MTTDRSTLTLKGLAMSSDGFTVFDTSIVHSIRNAHALGLYCYLKSIGGNSTVDNLKNDCNCSVQKLTKSIKHLESLGLVDYTCGNLITILK